MATYIPPYQQQLYKTLEAQIKLLPQELAARYETQPGVTALGLQDLNQFLLGTPEQSFAQYAWEAPLYSRGGKTSGGGLFGDLFGGDKPKKRLVRPGRYVKSGTSTMAAQRGFLDLYANEIMPTLSTARSEARAADIRDVAKLSPAAREAIRISNPDAAALLDELYGQAQSDLNLGQALNPAEVRNLTQAVRGGQAARGMGYGTNDLFEEALTSLDYGRGLEKDRRAFAEDIIGQLQGFYGNPFERILARGNGAEGLGAAGAALGASQQGSPYNPESDYAGSIFNTVFNANQAKAINAKNNQYGLIGSGIQAAGSLLGGAMGAI